jgi:hypothetical protein
MTPLLRSELSSHHLAIVIERSCLVHRRPYLCHKTRPLGYVPLEAGVFRRERARLLLECALFLVQGVDPLLLPMGVSQKLSGVRPGYCSGR